MNGEEPGLRSSYQRMPEEFLPVFTEWLTTMDSWVPKFRYAARCMSRSPRESSDSPPLGCATQMPPPQASRNRLTFTSTGPEKVECAGAVKSTWNCQIWKEFPESIVPR